MQNSNIIDAKYHNKAVSIQCNVIGKSEEPYCIPKKIKIICSNQENVLCSTCKIAENKILIIEAFDENILKFIDVSSSVVYRTIKEMCGAHKKCVLDYEILEMQNIDRIFTTPPISIDRTKIQMSIVSYYMGSDIETNVAYELSGYTTVDPKSQSVTHVFTKATRLKSNIEAFILDKKKHQVLHKEFSQYKDAAQIFDFLNALYGAYAHRITKIYGRFDLHLAIDLIFKSALSFQFDNEYVHKGWLDVIVMGDMRCGKGYVAQGLATYLNVGEVMNAESCTFAGLVGGIDKFEGSYTLIWGKIPQNDCGLLVVDEASGLNQKQWDDLTRIRSEGVAEITKIRTQTTHARTRLLFLCNPVCTYTSKLIASYSYGVQAIAEMIKSPADIARFDYALIVAENEVPDEEINKRHESVPEVLSRDLDQYLTSWIWSRTSKDIQFSEQAIDLVYDQANILGKIYTKTIPLIQGENIRVKLAKIAVCFAGRMYSNKDNGKILYVDKVHVECARIFLDLIYKKDVSGYYAMSKLEKSSHEEHVDTDLKAIDAYINAYHRVKDELCKCLLNNNSITANDLSEHINQPEIARDIISKLLKHNCIKKRSTYYVKTSQFTQFLKNKILKG